MNDKVRWKRPHTYVGAIRKLRSKALTVRPFRLRQRAPKLRDIPSSFAPTLLLPIQQTIGQPEVRARSLWRRIGRVLFPIILTIIIVLSWLVHSEMRSSERQAHFFANLAGKMKYAVKSGPSSSIRYPQESPYDERLGYSNLPEFFSKLKAKDFQITAQAQISPDMRALSDEGIFIPYREKIQVGLSILDSHHQPLFEARYPERVYSGFEDTPALLVKSLLFIENRDLLDPDNPKRNPAVEWDRLGKAVLDKGLHVFSTDKKSAGGSTLATQIEKYRHSFEGRTTSLKDKLYQMFSASLRAYHQGEDTRAVRRQLVVDYLNTVPLSAKAGYGEVNGVGDGMWVWYGRDFAEVNQLLKNAEKNRPGTGVSSASAQAYKQALSLLISQRRPSFYLTNQTALDTLTNSYLRLLAHAGVISSTLSEVAIHSSLNPRKSGNPAASGTFVTRKAATAVRTQLSGLLGDSRLYNLDRLDLSVTSTLDAQAQKAVTTVLRNLRDPAIANAEGLQGKGLLGKGDPANVIYSFTLLERGEKANYLRIQTDNFDQPLDINDGAKLDLGSTAKLRTMVTYLEIVADLHKRNSSLETEQLRKVTVDPQDVISRWAIDYLQKAKDKSLPAMLEAALGRSYSASPAESFFTGGGIHTFNNFHHEDDSKTFSVRDGLRSSINLVFVRLLRDVVHYYMFQTAGSSASLLQDADNPRRDVYLSRFADREGRVFIQRFYTKYRDMTAEQAQAELLDGLHPTPSRLASVFRMLAPNEPLDKFAIFVKENLHSENEVSSEKLAKLYEQYSPGKMSLADRGFLATVHPLELWIVGYMRLHPQASLSEVQEASKNERQDVYFWLFNTHRKQAQDQRILSLLEVEGFLEIHRQWKRLGYPFDSLVPSYATALGASADRPAALAELMGILVNGGVRKPTERVQILHFAAGTPYETVLKRKPGKSEQVLPKEVTEATLRAIREVVENGTAKRVRRAFIRTDGSVIPVGGKTGTGDQRFDVYGVHGQLIEQRFVNRTATFLFNIDERFFGSITAYVHGPQAANYDFTSALPAQLLKVLAPSLMPMLEPVVSANPKVIAASGQRY